MEPTPIETEATSLEEEEPIASRTRSHDSEPVASRTRSQQDLTEIAGFADVKTRYNLHEWLNEIAFVTSETSDPSEPQTFQQVWQHSDLKAREKWHDGIKLEFNRMISIGVWRIVGSTSIPNGRRLVVCCWVFKIKRMESVPDWLQKDSAKSHEWCDLQGGVNLNANREVGC